eukprot:11191867-Lingulodinium_polyedra.AAC.1
MLRNDAVESTIRRRGVSQTARSHTPRARQKTGARLEYANAQFANRCGGRWPIRSHPCATFRKRCTMA